MLRHARQLFVRGLHHRCPSPRATYLPSRSRARYDARCLASSRVLRPAPGRSTRRARVHGRRVDARRVLRLLSVGRLVGQLLHQSDESTRRRRPGTGTNASNRPALVHVRGSRRRSGHDRTRVSHRGPDGAARDCLTKTSRSVAAHPRRRLAGSRRLRRSPVTSGRIRGAFARSVGGHSAARLAGFDCVRLHRLLRCRGLQPAERRDISHSPNAFANCPKHATQPASCCCFASAVANTPWVKSTRDPVPWSENSAVTNVT